MSKKLLTVQEFNAKMEQELAAEENVFASARSVDDVKTMRKAFSLWQNTLKMYNPPGKKVMEVYYPIFRRMGKEIAEKERMVRL